MNLKKYLQYSILILSIVGGGVILTFYSLCNKKKTDIVFFGDSVTEFGDIPESIEEITGYKVAKIGFGGCRMSKRKITDKFSKDYDSFSMAALSEAIAGDNYADQWKSVMHLLLNYDHNFLAFWRLITTDYESAKTVVIFFGTNDFTASENVIGNIDSSDDFEFMGAINNVVKRMKLICPNANIILATPTHRYFSYEGGVLSDSNNTRNKLGLYLKDYRDAIICAAENHNCEILDLFDISGFTETNHKFFFKDGVHPNSFGYRHLATLFTMKILEINKQQ